MRKDIRGLTEAYEQVMAPANTTPNYEIKGRKIFLHDVPTVNKNTDQEEDIMYVFEFSKFDTPSDLLDRKFAMYVGNQEVNPADYYYEESDAASMAVDILSRENDIESQ